MAPDIDDEVFLARRSDEFRHKNRQGKRSGRMNEKTKLRRCAVLAIIAAAIAWNPAMAQTVAGDAAASIEQMSDAEMRQQLAQLIIKDKIREQANRYSLLLEGGPGQKPDGVMWVNSLFTRDAIIRGFRRDGSPQFEWKGREEIMAAVTNSERRDTGLPGTRASRHYWTNLAFDEITPTQVKARVVALTLSAGRTGSQASCRPPSCVNTPTPIGGSVFSYNLIWGIEDGQWKMSLLEYHNDGGGTQ